MSSYVEKYNFTLNDFHGNIKKILIEEDGYTGNSSSLILKGNDPAKISYSGEDKELYDENVFGSKLQLELWAQIQGEYDEFLSVSNRKYRITVKKQGISETKYIGNYTISQIASNPEIYSFYLPTQEPTGDYHLENDPTRYTSGTFSLIPKIRIKIAGIIKATFEITSDIVMSSDASLHKVIENLIENDSSYIADSELGYYYRIKKEGQYSFTDSITIEKYYKNYKYVDNTAVIDYDNPPYWGTEDSGNFGGGYIGDNFQLKVNEGTIITLFDYTLQSDDSKQDIISQAINAINSNVDYQAEQDTENTDKIIVTYDSTGDASTYILQVTTSASANDWGITATGLNKVITSAYNIVWQGFLISGASDRAYIAPPYPYTIEATDGIADLKGYNFDYGKNILSYIRVIALILQETGLKLDIYSAADKYEDSMDVSKNPLSQLYIHQESISNKNGRDIIKELLASSGYELRQHKGKWLIKPVNSIGTINCTVFDYQGNVKDMDTINLKKYISNKSNYISNGYGVNIGMDAILRLQAAYQGFLYKLNYGLKEQLLKDPTLSIFDSSNKLLFYNGDINYFQNIDKLLEFSVDNQTIQQKIDILDYAAKLKIEFKGKLDIEIIVARTTKWWSEIGWINAESILEYNHSKMDVETFNLDYATNYSPSIFRLRLTAYNGTVIKSAKLDAKEGTFENGKSQYLYYLGFGGYKKDDKELEYNKGDVPVSSWATLKYLNTLMLSDGSQTISWGGQELVRKTSEEIAQEILQPSRMIEGSFLFKDFIGSIHNIESTFDNKIYRFMGGSYSLKLNRVQGKWVEINKSDPGGLVVEDRLFEGKPQGTDTYSSNRSSYGGGGGISVDLSEYLTENEILALIQGYTETFTGADLTSRQKTVYHNLNRILEFAALYKDGVRQSPANFEINDDDNKNNCILTVNIPYTDSTTFEIRVL